MTIRNEQMRAFHKAGDETFARQLHKEVETQQPSAAARFTGDGLSEFIKAGMRTARSYGLTWESSLATFIRLQLEFGEEFHHHPPIQAVLADTSIPGNAKIGFLERSVTARDWWECLQNSTQRQSSAAA